jgi:hypothetical protein
MYCYFVPTESAGRENAGFLAFSGNLGRDPVFYLPGRCFLWHVLDIHPAIVPFQNHTGQLVARADQMLIRVRPPPDRTAGMDLRSNRYNP